MCWWFLCPRKSEQLAEELLSESDNYPIKPNLSQQSLITEKSTLEQISIIKQQTQQKPPIVSVPPLFSTPSDDLRRKIKMSRRKGIKKNNFAQQSDKYNLNNLSSYTSKGQRRRYESHDMEIRNQRKYSPLMYFANSNQRDLSEEKYSIYSWQKQPEILRIFGQQKKVDYIYSNNDPDNPIYISFQCRKKEDVKEPLEYYFKKYSNRMIALIGKRTAIKSKMDIIERSNQNIWAINYTNDQTLGQDRSNDANSLKFVRWNKIQTIIIFVNNIKGFKQACDYVSSLIKWFTEREKKRIVFYFSANISLQSIAKLLHMVHKEEMAKTDIHRFISEYYFQLIYFETGGIETGIGVSVWEDGQPKKRNMFFQSLKITLSILGSHYTLDERYFYILREFYNLIKKRPSKDLVYMRKIFHENFNEFRMKIREIRNWDGFQLVLIEHENYLANIPYHIYKDFMIITATQRTEILRIIEHEEKKQPQTPVDKQWDDGLEQKDIPLPEYNQSYLTGLDTVDNKEMQQEKLEESDEQEDDQAANIEIDLNIRNPEHQKEEEAFFNSLFDLEQIDKNLQVAHFSHSSRKKSCDL